MTAPATVALVHLLVGAVSPLAFSAHPGAWVAILVVTAGYTVVVRSARFSVTRRQALSFLAAMVALVAATTWPLADLAARHLLVALVVQRLLLLLAVPPLLIGGLPRPLVAAATRPGPIDWLARTCSRAVPAVVVVTVVAVGTLTVPVVEAQASSAIARGGLDLVLLAGGVVLWLPALQPVPATQPMPAFGKAGYLVVQSILPSFLSIVWIFARHPLYPVYAHPGQVLTLSPLTDQELSGFVAKLATIFVLWTVAFVVVHRTEQVVATGGDPEPLTWADVERQLERVARRESRGAGAPREAAPHRPPLPRPNTRHRRQRNREGDGPTGSDRPGAG